MSARLAGLFARPAPDPDADPPADEYAEPAGHRTLGPAELDREVYGAVERKEPVMLVGPPGVGKTYTVKKVADRAKRDRKIKTFEVVVGDKNLTPDALFESRLIIKKSGERFVRLLPSLIRRHVRGSLLPIDEVTAEEAVERWKDDDYLLLVLDEASRCTPSFVDALLPLLNDFQVTIEGRTFYAPILMILMLNPPGMDSTAAAFSHALTSRIYQRFTIKQPGPRELCDIYTLPHVLRDAERFKLKLSVGELADTARLACGTITLLWGLPVEGRPGMASLSDDAVRLIRRAAAADPQLAADLTVLGKLVKFGPDARKGRRWTITAAHQAVRDGDAVGDRYLLRTCVSCLAVGGKQTFSEGQEPHRQAEFENLIYRVTERALTNQAVRELLLDPPAARPREFDPAAHAAGLFDAPPPADAGHRVRKLWEAFGERLRADAAGDRPARRREAGEFLKLLAGQQRPQDGTTIDAAVRGLMVGEKLLRPDRPGDPDLAFATAAQQALAHRLAVLAGLWPSAKLAALGRVIAGVPVDREEEARLAALRAGLPAARHRELVRLLAARPGVRGRCDLAARLLALASGGTDGLADRVKNLWAGYQPQGPDGRREPMAVADRAAVLAALRAWLGELGDADAKRHAACVVAAAALGEPQS